VCITTVDCFSAQHVDASVCFVCVCYFYRQVLSVNESVLMPSCPVIFEFCILCHLSKCFVLHVVLFSPASLIFLS